MFSGWLLGGFGGFRVVLVFSVGFGWFSGGFKDDPWGVEFRFLTFPNKEKKFGARVWYSSGGFRVVLVGAVLFLLFSDGFGGFPGGSKEKPCVSSFAVWGLSKNTKFGAHFGVCVCVWFCVSVSVSVSVCVSIDFGWCWWFLYGFGGFPLVLVGLRAA